VEVFGGGGEVFGAPFESSVDYSEGTYKVRCGYAFVTASDESSSLSRTPASCRRHRVKL